MASETDRLVQKLEASPQLSMRCSGSWPSLLVGMALRTSAFSQCKGQLGGKLGHYVRNGSAPLSGESHVGRVRVCVYVTAHSHERDHGVCKLNRTPDFWIRWTPLRRAEKTNGSDGALSRTPCCKDTCPMTSDNFISLWTMIPLGQGKANPNQLQLWSC